MSTIEEVASGVITLLDQRASRAQHASEQAEAQREAEAQRQIAETTENARMQRQHALQNLATLENTERTTKASLDAKVQQHDVLGREVQALFGQHNFLLMQLHQMKKQLGL